MICALHSRKLYKYHYFIASLVESARLSVSKEAIIHAYTRDILVFIVERGFESNKECLLYSA